MTAATTYTYDATTPYRPALADLGGADFENDPLFPPDRTTMPNAEEANERARNQAGLNRVTPVAIIHVTVAAGTPTIANVRGMRSTIVPGDFGCTGATGSTTISWASTVLPSTVIPPVVSLAQEVEIDRVRAYLMTSTSIRVKTALGATGASCNFVLLVF